MGKKLLLLFLLVFFVNSVYAATDIEISEIMYDPTNVVSGAAKDSFRCDNDSSCQWIEIHNKESSSEDLSSWKLKVNTRTNGNEIYDFEDIVILPGEYIVVATQLGDEDGDGFSFSKLYGNQDGAWDANVDGFRAVNSDVPFIRTPDVGPDSNPDVDIELLDGSNAVVDQTVFSAHFNGPVYFVQKSNGYTMEKDSQGNFVQSLNLGGSPGKNRNAPPVFSNIPNLSLNEDQILDSRLIDFRNFVSDPDDSDDNLVFSITSFNSNPSNLLNCGVIGSESNASRTYFLNCSDLGKDLNGSIYITVSASDGELSASKNFKIIVNPVNDAATFTSIAPDKTTVTLPYTYDADAQDIEGNPFIFSLRRAPTGMRINSSTGVINWTPTESQLGNHSIEVVITDILTQAERNSGLVAANSTQEFDVFVEPVFGFSNVDIAYGEGNLNGVISSQIIPRVFTASNFTVTSAFINRHPVEQGVNVLMEGVRVTAKLSRGSQVFFDKDISAEFNMNSLEIKQVPFTFIIPRNLSNGVYNLTLNAEGNLFDLDEELRDKIVPQSQTFVLYLDVQQARHDVYISSMNVYNGEVCGRQSELNIEVKNSGSLTERDVQLSSLYPFLNINFNTIIDRIFPGETRTASVNLTNAAGKHNITAQAAYSGGTSEEVITNFESCVRKGDLNKDFCINAGDVTLLSSKFGLKNSSNGFDNSFDLNQDNAINFDDFYVLADLIGPGECTTIVSETEEPKASVVGGEEFSVGVSQLKVIIQQGSSSISQFFVTNKGNTSFAVSNTLDGIFSIDDKAISFDFPGFFSLLAGSFSSINLKTSVPEQFKVGSYNGAFTLKTTKQITSLPIEVEVIPDLCEEGIKGSDISIDIDDPDSNEDFKPGDTIDVDLSVRNSGETRDISIEGILWNADKDEEVESFDADSVEIDKGDTEKDDFDFEITIPEDVKDDKIVLYIKSFEDGNEEQTCTVQSLELDVDREKNDVRIAEVTAQKELQCESNAVFRVSARNFGKNDEENVLFRIANDELGLLEESKTFTLKEFDKNGDFVSETLSFNVPLTRSERSLFLVSVVYDDGAQMQSVDKEIRIACSEDKLAEDQVSTRTQPNLKEETAIQGKGVKVVQSATKKVETDVLIQTAVFLSFVLGLSIVTYALKGAILIRK
ncbi:lamin tail domain-containing protein [Candidatus Woesearchaeota archaeon]|nr:lamin tail domain-containing protein [Candidatus Woesearchaeota archaeon]